MQGCEPDGGLYSLRYSRLLEIRARGRDFGRAERSQSHESAKIRTEAATRGVAPETHAGDDAGRFDFDAGRPGQNRQPAGYGCHRPARV